MKTYIVAYGWQRTAREKGRSSYAIRADSEHAAIAKAQAAAKRDFPKYALHHFRVIAED